jgi:hypothetical protein
LTLLNLIAVTIGIVAAHMQFALLINQVAVHRRVAFITAMLNKQQARLGFIVIVGANHFVAGHQVDGFLTALFWIPQTGTGPI